jgi:hypothetical protein
MKRTWILELPDVDPGSDGHDEVAWLKREHRIQDRSARLWITCKAILDEYGEDKLTLRQLYYQLVGRGYIENTANSYDNLGTQLTNARKIDFIPWTRFENRSRSIQKGERSILDLAGKRPSVAARDQVRYALDPNDWTLPRWHGQPQRVEVWTEKDALVGIMGPICAQWGVSLVVSRGYTSYTYRREAMERLNDGATWTLFYFGDLDPSGVDITRMLDEEFEGIDVIRVGLTPAQVDGLPHNFAKEADSRHARFIEAYPELEGTCYELDALPPNELRTMLRDAIASRFNNEIDEDRRRTIAEWTDAYHGHLDELRQVIDWDQL